MTPVISRYTEKGREDDEVKERGERKRERERERERETEREITHSEYQIKWAWSMCNYVVFVIQILRIL